MKWPSGKKLLCPEEMVLDKGGEDMWLGGVRKKDGIYIGKTATTQIQSRTRNKRPRPKT